jgi:CBS domain-containing protein
MTAGVHCCASTDTIAEAEATMRAGRVRRLPVVDAGRRLVGLVSLDDIALAAVRAEGEGLLGGRFDQENLARTLAAICRHRVVAGA